MKTAAKQTRLQKLLEEHLACDDGKKWAEKFKTASAAWEACETVEWMLWALSVTKKADERKHRLFACACVRGTPLKNSRTVWDLLTDERSRNAVEVSERFADGKATETELDAAWAAARAAAGDAAGDAARDAARAAARAAAWDAVVDAAWAAARAAAWDAAWAAARAAAWDAAGDAAWAWQADKLREIYGNPWRRKAAK